MQYAEVHTDKKFLSSVEDLEARNALTYIKTHWSALLREGHIYKCLNQVMLLVDIHIGTKYVPRTKSAWMSGLQNPLAHIQFNIYVLTKETMKLESTKNGLATNPSVTSSKIRS